MEQTIEQEVEEQGLRLVIDMNRVPAPQLGMRSSDIEKLLLEGSEESKYSFIRYM